MRTIVIAANPKSGSRSRIEIVEGLQRKLALESFRVIIESSLESLERRVQSSYADGDLETVIAAGGDGTVSTVASRTPAAVPITVLPLGSENLLARYYGFTDSPDECVSRILKREAMTIDAIDINGKLAMIMVSLGFDADVVRRVHLHRKSHVTRWAYRFHALRSWLYYRWPQVQISSRGRDPLRVFETVGQWIFVFNIPRYATDLQIVKESDPRDGWLNVGLFERSGPIRGLFQYVSVMRGAHYRRSDWKQFESSELECRSTTSVEASVQYDGDYAGQTPISIRVVPKRITLLR